MLSPHKPLLAALLRLALLLLLWKTSESLQLHQRPATTRTGVGPANAIGRRWFLAQAAAVVTLTKTADAAKAAIDVSGLQVEGGGRAPNQPPSGPLAGTKLGFQVGGGPRPEEEVRKIDEARYRAAGKGPSFLVGVPREKVQKKPDTSIANPWSR